ncbi:MAG: hypothetical protein ACLSCQ_00520 [Evtepia gabavorous]
MWARPPILFAGGVLPWICFLLLAGLGIVKIFDSSLKALIRRHRDLHRQWQFSAFHFRVILNIYANPEQADQDRSGALSVGEATALAVALSLDSLTVGVGAGLDQTPVFAAVLLSLFWAWRPSCWAAGWEISS